MHDMAGATLNITDAGRAALVNGDHSGTAARKVVQVGVATAPFVFNPGMQVMPNEFKRVGTISGENIAPDTVHVTIRDDGQDQFKLYGFGLYLDNGVLLGTYCQTTPIMEKSPVSILLVAVDVVFKTLDVSALTFGNTNFTNPPATTERQGVVELATRLETIEGTDTLRAVTPDALNARTATEARTGLVQLATDAEVLAGKDDGKAVTPKKMAAQLTKKAELAGAKTQAFAVAQASNDEHAVPLAQADQRYATPSSVRDAKDMANRALDVANAALPRAGGDVTGQVNLKGSAVELQFTDTQQPVTLGRFRMVSSGKQLVLDRNTAVDGSFSQFFRMFTVDWNGNATAAGNVTGAYLRTQSNVNLPAYNNDGRGFLEFGADMVIWRLYMFGPTGDLTLSGYNANGTNRNQPFSISYTTGQFLFTVRPNFNGAVPWDTGNLPNPLTTDGGGLAANRALYFGVGYGRSALVVSSNGTDSIGGAFVDWNGTRTPALQVDCPSNSGAYMGIRWTQWGQRHLAAIDAYAGGSDGSIPSINFHIGKRTRAWTFDENDILRWDGNAVWGRWNFDPATKANVSDVYTKAVVDAALNAKADSARAEAIYTDLYRQVGSRAAGGAVCQWNTGITEFGAVSTGESAGYADLPAPYVLVGLRNTFYMHYLRAVQLRNQ